LIHRVRGRDAFQRLAHDATRIRRPAVWCHWCPDPSTNHLALAFSISRAIGPAVTRNRLRRRIRAVMRQLEPEMPGGMLLIGARPGIVELTFAQLQAELTSIVRSLPSTPRS
jgi:ribonuclease P protein component